MRSRLHWSALALIGAMVWFHTAFALADSTEEDAVRGLEVQIQDLEEEEDFEDFK